MAKYDLDLVIDEKNSLSLMLQQIMPNSVVLEFGPANGRLTKYLKEKMGCQVYIVEIDEEAVQDAIKYSVDAIIGDAEKLEWLSKWEGIHFDYILFADVLEHLHDPQTVLSKTKSLLKDDGKVILSVPNISHDSIMINLFNNIFNYTPLGLLDNTHIHLFAYNTLKQFCHFAGYTPVIEDAIYANVGETEISNSYSDISRDAKKSLKSKKYGNVYQFVFTLQKTEYIKYNTHETDLRIKSNIPHNDVKIYLNRGNGWGEDNCITYRITPQQIIEKKIVLENSEDIIGIRIDPLDTSGVFRFNAIQIRDAKGEVKYNLNHCYCNGSVVGDYLYCEHNDPQITIEQITLVGKTELYISYELVLFDVDSEIISYIVNNTTNNAVVCEMQEELERRAVELDNIMKSINEVQSKLIVVENEKKLQAEELERRRVELDNIMTIINELGGKLAVVENEKKLQAEELERRRVELDNRMTVINELRNELAAVENERKLQSEELGQKEEQLENKRQLINELKREVEEIKQRGIVDIIKQHLTR